MVFKQHERFENKTEKGNLADFHSSLEKLASFKADLEVKQINLNSLEEETNSLEINSNKSFTDLKLESIGSKCEFSHLNNLNAESIQLDSDLIKGKFTREGNKIAVEDRKVQWKSNLEVDIVFNEETEEFFNKNLVVEMASALLSDEKEEPEEEEIESLLGKKRKLSSESENEGFFPKTQKKEEEVDVSKIELNLESYLKSLK